LMLPRGLAGLLPCLGCLYPIFTGETLVHCVWYKMF